jgi:branched-subunit amino acid transport protein
MSMWLAILLVALGSYTFRVVPMLLGERVRLSERADATLQHAAVGAMTALLVLGLKHVGGDALGREMFAACIAVAVSSAVALRGLSMLLVVLFGGAAYGVAVLGFARLAA